MKKLLIILTLLTSLPSYAEIASIEVGGIFVNSEGCRAYQVYCTNFKNENDERPYNTCRLELYINGKQVAYLGKGGKIIKANGEKIVAQDKGWRSSMSIPQYVNVKAEFIIKETYDDPMTYPENSVSSFDLIIKRGPFNRKVAHCKNMVWEEE